MIVNFLKSKIHRATVTDCNLHYEGSIGIDEGLMREVGLSHWEQVDVYNITNGERLTTYAIPEPEGSGVISIRGSAAHKANIGDLIIICSYCGIDSLQISKHKPSVVLVDEKNKVKRKS
ncbi:MAG: aspartate 1-decarboxylase [Rickettsiales bacterium]|nr:aspartate 1-decarboxylase [Rickettsiales bacterium]